MGWVKALIRSGLKIVLNRERFNDSAIYRLYLRLAYPDHVQRVARTTAFYERELAAVKAKMVFDIGANCGDKTVLYAALGISSLVLSLRRGPYSRCAIVLQIPLV